MKSAVFVKSSKASEELFSSKKMKIDNMKKIRLVTDDNIIIMVGVYPGGGSDFTPTQFIKKIQGSALNNEKKAPIKKHKYHNAPVADRKIRGTDDNGKKVNGLQSAMKRWGHMVSIFIYMDPSSERTARRVTSTMLDNMKVVDK